MLEFPSVSSVNSYCSAVIFFFFSSKFNFLICFQHWYQAVLPVALWKIQALSFLLSKYFQEVLYWLSFFRDEITSLGAEFHRKWAIEMDLLNLPAYQVYSGKSIEVFRSLYHCQVGWQPVWSTSVTFKVRNCICGYYLNNLILYALATSFIYICKSRHFWDWT